MRAFRYRLYPTKAQEAALLDTLRLTRELYNAALQERRDAHRKVGKSVSVYEQMRSLPEVKAVRPEFKTVHAHVLQGVVTQLDRAFRGFFRRVKQGVTAGYPRFKGADRWDSFAFK
ncbi:RNA-guided endonuclease InsQ/TnpB family protein [Deinococcus apachensis]|uniref:RNA-guided endonuclease InsQ/TnpB family protein n=1 Tax=Deinococcus apachensis TaxID=309886 RepID=UPI0003A0E06D|nr:helix-turn-helix domain-containing protein [Deinococcus apachensis]